ncbi:MAG: c-type cytochrome [Mucilaginibacter sp.]|nr:c-type cytochrome [Mucilaginibacter sp.]
MKLKILIIGTLCIVFTAITCHTFAQVKKTSTTKKAAASVAKTTAIPAFATVQEIEDGKGLIAKSDCLACHNTEKKLVGPAYIAVAEKYPQNQNTVNTLSQKIISGGSGVWGAVPMAPHPTITLADANKMIKYILTLKNTPGSLK